ncbi:hypothetical protein WICPIJ_009587 [Wickerhamomyces pijperi]|uniref:U3 small nucleolar RNA-associated protein 15 C-terminal domain-containing protein n=1 Tax=Wickerhamomyces pijperi TaxID=599730 RepID=A0A9P8PL48_WICPI|nr:hypothetical protein WICPIJ_009587 [Wickerhamomyces pijperi]
MSSSNRRVIVAKTPVLPAQTTPEQRYWRTYASTQLVKEHNAVSHICFNPISPHDFAITSSTRIQVFSSKTREVVKTFSRFKDTVYCGEYRFDGKLLVAGDASGLVQIFDAVQPRTLLVTINPSSHPTHVAKFHPTVPTNLLTCSDDRVARLYDISQATKPIISFDDHEDYIRTGGFIEGSNLITTGCYDGVVRVYDQRTGTEPIIKFQHQSPVEDILSTNPTVLLSAGGNSIKVWDLTAGKVRNEMNNFQKTVTCLNKNEHGILAGSLDGHVKVFDEFDWEVKFGWKFGGAVLSCGVSPDSKHFVAGLASGLLSIKTKKSEPKVKQGVKAVKSNSFKKMMRGGDYKGEEEHRIVANNNTSASSSSSTKLRPYEKYLNSFKWSEALDCAFKPGMSRELTMTVLEELKKRGKVRVSLLNRDENSLETMMLWFMKLVEDVRSVYIVVDFMSVLFELYAGVLEKVPVLKELLKGFYKKLNAEIEKAKEAEKIRGMLQLLTSV